MGIISLWYFLKKIVDEIDNKRNFLYYLSLSSILSSNIYYI